MEKCQYDYEQKCTCAEDDNCGCDNSKFTNKQQMPVVCKSQDDNKSDEQTQFVLFIKKNIYKYSSILFEKQKIMLEFEESLP